MGKASKCKIRGTIESPKCSDKLKNILVVQFNFPGMLQAKVAKFMSGHRYCLFRSWLCSQFKSFSWYWINLAFQVTPICSLFCKEITVFLAFFRPFLFWKGICKVPRCNGLDILVPKHLWQSKIGPLQLILATNRYVSFFWFTHFENEKWNEKALRSRSRMKSEMKMPWDWDREWKVKWKCLKIEIEKWNFSRNF